ncbi:efflux RND transporter permease subunit [Coxiella-like endosymbiont]|uniref:efflux RND transporter permease subunit n=1 Tax=Coxiella-like endosymbiont TaxID=1592897 RepID=UPI0034E29300
MVLFNLFFSALLVIGVIFLFLNNLLSTIIAVFLLPSSVIATFGFMYLCGFSLDNLFLMELVLAVGFLIDDASSLRKYYTPPRTRTGVCRRV